MPTFINRPNKNSVQARTVGPAPLSAPAWIDDTRHTKLVGFLVGLLVWRLVIPGFFTYEDGAPAPSGLVDLLTNQLVWASLLVVPLLLLRSRLALTWRLLRSCNPFLLILLMYAGASIAWSIDAGATSRRSLHLVILLVISLLAGLVAWEPRRFQNLIRPILTGLLVGSLLFAIIDPEAALTEPNFLLGEHGRHLRGLADHKNSLGALASYGCLLWFHGWLYDDVKPKHAAMGFLVSFLCLMLAGSSTSMLGTFFAIAFFLLTKAAPPALRRLIPYLAVVFAAITLCYGLAVLRVVPALDFLITSITDVTGKDATFTGRTTIWELVKDHIALSPIEGSGYGAYWTGDVPGTASSLVKKKMYFYPNEAHNGYLDVINDLGYVGLSLLVCFLVYYLISALRLLKVDRPQAVLVLGILFYELLSNLSESSWMSVAFPWLLLGFASILTSRALLEQRLRDQFGIVQKPSRAIRRPRSRRRPAA